MTDRQAKRTVEYVQRLLAERDILDTRIPINEVVEKRFEFPTPEIRSKLTEKVEEFRKRGKVDWSSII